MRTTTTLFQDQPPLQTLTLHRFALQSKTIEPTAVRFEQTGLPMSLVGHSDQFGSEADLRAGQARRPRGALTWTNRAVAALAATEKHVLSPECVTQGTHASCGQLNAGVLPSAISGVVA